MKEKYCYISDVLNEEFKAEKYDFDKDHYDPDTYSSKLYEDLCLIFKDRLPFKNMQATKNVITDEKGNQYGSDYIGPSWNWARSTYNFTNQEIGEGLLKTRVLGGHMLWLRTSPSINQGKGGRGIFDRFDLCLDEIKKAYEDHFINIEGTHKNHLRKIIVSQKAWFEAFEDFKHFVDCFYLNDFVDENYNVISLALSKPSLIILVDTEADGAKTYLPGPTKEDYCLYVENCISVIEKRTERMCASKS